jgi:hypothetical protein
MPDHKGPENALIALHLLGHNGDRNLCAQAYLGLANNAVAKRDWILPDTIFPRLRKSQASTEH